MRKLTKVLPLVLSLLLLASCDSDKYIVGTDIALTPEDCNIHQVVTRIYTDEELEELANSEFSSIEELNERYPIECVREVFPEADRPQDDRIDYRISYCGDKKYVSIYALYDPDPEDFAEGVIAPDQKWMIYQADLLDARHDLAWFEKKVKIGMPLGIIETEVDPDGSYPHHHGGVIRIVSCHYTSDGYSVVIYYSPRPVDGDYTEALVEEIVIQLL